MNEQAFKSAFNELLGSRGMNSQKLSELSGVPERYIEALRVGNIGKLPPEPYVRGYLNRICKIFSVDSTELWEKYLSDYGVKIAANADRLPANRFSLKKLSKGKITLGAVAIILITFFVWRFSDIIGQPKLTIDKPAMATVITSLDHFEVSGSVTRGDALTLNDESVHVGEDGKFSEDLKLYPGVNTLQFEVRRSLGRKAQQLRKIIYSPEGQTNPEPTPTLTLPTSTSTSSTIKINQ